MKLPYDRRALFLFVACFCLLFFLIPRLTNIEQKITRNLRTFITLGGNYEKLNETSLLYRTIKEARSIIPSDAKVRLSHPSDEFGLRYIIIRYYLYPRTIDKNGPYFIDLDHTFPIPPQELISKQLPSGINVYAKPGSPFTSVSHDHQALLGRNLFLFICLSLWMGIMGSFILKGFSFSPQTHGRGWFYSTSYLVGLGVFNMVFWIYLMAAGRLNTLSCSLWMLVTSIIVTLFYRKSPWADKLFAVEKPSDIQNTKGDFNLFLNAASFFTVILFVGIIVSIPISVWDEMFIWVMKSRMFFYKEGLDFSYTVGTNNYYPLLWPINNAFYLTMIGDYDEILKWISALTFVAFLFQFKKALNVVGVKRSLSWICVASYLIVFHHWTFFTALPENLFMAFLTAILVCVLCAFKDPANRRIYFLLGLAMAVGLTLTKFEGAVTAFLCAVPLALLGKSLQLQKKDYVILMGFLLLFLLPWGWSRWVQGQGYDVTMYHLRGRLSLENLNGMADIIKNFFLDTRGIYLAGALILSLIVVRNYTTLRREEVYLLLVMAGLIVFGLAAGLLWPSVDFQRYYPEVFSRLLVRASPALMLLWAARTFKC